MRFRLLNPDLCCAGLAAVLVFAGARALYAGNLPPQPIEVVPSRISEPNTNASKTISVQKRDLDAAFPGVPRHLEAESLQGMPPTPPPPNPAARMSQHDKDVLDRRRNWVFMTPEEMVLGTDTKKALDPDKYAKEATEKEPASAMERYYERLTESDRVAATNRMARMDDRDGRTNSFTSADIRDKDANPFSSPFNSEPSTPVFQSARPRSFSDVFGLSADSSIPSPEEIRARQEQEVHMENFKQMWDIGQPQSTVSPVSVSSPVSTPGSSFGSTYSSPSIVNPSVTGIPAQPTPASSQPTTTPIHTSLPRPDFTAPQRRF